MAGLPSSLDTALTEAERASYGIPDDLKAQFKKQEEQLAQRKKETDQPIEMPALPTKIGKAPGSIPFQSDFIASSQRYGVPINVLMALAEQESRFNPSALGSQTKWGRAKGLMQYLDSTAAGMGINPYNPTQSIDAAARQLRERLDKGYSMIDAVREHFAGPDRKQWGPKTAAYGNEVMARAARLQGFTPSGQPAAAPQGATAQQPGTVEKLNAKEPGRYRALSESEMQRMQEAQAQGFDSFVPFAGAKPIKIQPANDIKISQPKADQSMLSRFGNALGSGYDNMTRSMSNAVWLVKGGDTTDVASNIFSNFKQQQEAQANRTPGQKRLDQAIDNVDKGEGFLDTLSRGWDAVKVAAQEPGAVFLGAAESLPNMAPSVVGAVGGAGAGAGVGAGAGALAGGVGAAPGAVAGAIWGGRIGFAAGTTAVEAGAELEHMVIDRLQKNKQPVTQANIKKLLDDPKFRADAQKQGAAKGLTLAAVDALTMGAAGRVLSAPARQAEKKAVRTIIKDTGVDEKAARSLLASPAGRAALEKASPGTLKKATAHVGAFGVELLGEPVSEAVSQAVARGSVDWSDVTGELIYGAGQAAAGTVGAKTIETGKAAYNRMRSGDAGTVNETTPAAEAAQQAAADAPIQDVTPAQPQADTVRKGPIERALDDHNENLRAQIDAELADVNGQQPAANAETNATLAPDADLWLGEPGTVAQITPKEDPESVYTVTVEGYDNGEVFARDQDGTPMQFGQNDVNVAQIQAPTVENTPAPELTTFEQPTAEAPKPAKAEKIETEQPSVEPAPKQSEQVKQPERSLADMDEQELRDRMKYLAGQAKATGGWNKRLMEERRKVEAAINKKQPAASDYIDGSTRWTKMTPDERMAAAEKAGVAADKVKDLSSQNWESIDIPTMNKLALALKEPKEAKAPEVKQPEAAATQSTDPSDFEALLLDAHVNNPAKKAQIIANEIKASGRTRGQVYAQVSRVIDNYEATKAPAAVKAAPAAAPVQAEATPVATETATETRGPLLGADGKPKWFFSREKAEAHVAKKKLGDDYQVKEVSKNRFEIHPTEAETQDTAPSNAAPSVVEETTDKPKSKQPLGKTTAQLNFERNLNTFEKRWGHMSIDKLESDTSRIDAHIKEQNSIIRNEEQHGKRAVNKAKVNKKSLQQEKDDLKRYIDYRKKAEAEKQVADRIDISWESSVDKQWIASNGMVIVDNSRTRNGKPYPIFTLYRNESNFNQEKAYGDYDSLNEAKAAAKSLVVTDTMSAVAQQPEQSKPKATPSANTLVTDDRAAELRARLKAKLSQLNSGIDPEILAIGAELAVYHIERGARTFAAFAKNVAADLDVSMDKVRPYLRSWYNGARDMLEDMGGSIEGMDSAETVRSELAKLDAGEQAAASEPKATTWEKAPDQNMWTGSNGMIITDESFDRNGDKITAFNIYRNQEEQAQGNYLATKETLKKAQTFADTVATQNQGDANVSSTQQRVEPDSGNTNASESIVSNTDGNATGPDASSTGRADTSTVSEQRTGQRDQRVPGDSTTTGRERGDQRIHRADGQFEPTERTARDPERSGSRVDSEQGQTTERSRTRAVIADAHSSGADELSQRIAAQKKADKTPTKWGDKASIDAALPLLLPEQREDVFKAETRLAGHNGILFTNGTGTGKTATGLGIVKRFINDGKDNVIVVVPSDKIASDWVKFAKMLGIELKQLDGIEDNGGSGPVVTTYANFGQNDTLAKRDWDLIIPDESHYLSSNETGDSTAALDQLRGLTGHHRGFYDWVRRRYSDEWKTLEDARKALADLKESDPKFAKLKAAEEAADKAWRDLENREREKWENRWEAQKDLPKVSFLSATPFAYVKNTDYAEGFLFHYVEPAELRRSQGQGGGYNSGSPRDRFMMQNFGYRMRYNKLTAPESGVNAQLMEQQFNEQLKKTGALSGRKLEVPFDYDRKFILVDDAVGTKIDNALKFLREQSLEAEKRARESNGDQAAMTEAELWKELFTSVDKRFDYQNRMYLLESIKAKAAVPLIRQNMKLGRKVVVFHDFNKGGAFDPFKAAVLSAKTPEQRAFNQDVFNKRADLFMLDLRDLQSPIDTLTKAFPDALIFNGTVSKGQRRANADRFNNDDGRNNLIIVQSDAGREGVSLHDTTGKHQRVEINLGMPTKPVAATQIEGRIYRTGQASDAIFRYLTTGTAWEASAFATKIAERASTAENLALGSEARGLKDAFIDAYQNADAHAPSENDGKGGKDYDRKLSATNSVSPFDKAKTFYWAQQKNSKNRNQREGTDYYATPEPVGFKMVEWANVKPGEKALEPSAGHGAIARFFPEQSDVTMIEPSYDLSQRAGLANGNAKIINDQFENLHINNKYDAIVMNPPYGNGGKISTEHLAKAATHLRDGGRIVALIPRGGMADNRLQQFLNSEQAADLYTVARIKMPSSTFDRAGTAVNTQILVLEKHKNKEDATGINESNIDLSGAQNVNELFDRIENVTLADRKPTSTPEPKQEIIEHTNAFGNTIRGTILTGIKKAEAQEIDPYTFRKKTEDGKQGWFIREKYLSKIPDDINFSRGAEPSTGSSRDQVRAALSDRFGSAAVAKLEKDGVLAIADTYTDPGVEGFTVGNRVTLVADALSPENIVPVFLHELGGHVGMQGVMKPETYGQLMQQFDRLVAAKDPLALEAKRLAEREPDPRTQQVEYLPYLVTVAARADKRSAGIRNFVNRIVSAVKAWAVDRLGMDLSLNARDVLALAERMVNAVSNTARSESKGPIDVTEPDIRFSRKDDDLAPVSSEEYASQLNKWSDALKNLPSDTLTNAMQKGLGLVPLRPMLNELAKDIPAAVTYLRVKDAMDSMRNKWHSKTDAVAQQWLKYRVKNPQENKDLMDIIHESTLMQVDPSQDFEPMLTPRDRIALKEMPADHPNRKKLEEKEERDAARKVAHEKLQERFRRLSPEGQSIYANVRDAYSDLADAFDKTLLDNMEKAINVRIKKAEREYKREVERITDEGLKGEERENAMADASRRLKNAKTKIAWNRKARMTQLRQQFETNRLVGPYFPLARFGNFFVTVRDKQTGEVVSFSRFENARDQRRFFEDVSKDPAYKVEKGALNDTVTVRKAVDPNFVADVEDILADLPNADQVKDEVWQRYLDSLPDFSIRKNRIHRKGRAGYDSDAVRAFGSHMFHGSHQLARLAHSMDLEDALDEARDQARETRDPVRSGLIVNEMDKRHQFVMSPTGGSLAQWASSFAFVWYLAGSPKAAIMNLFQTPIMGVPILGAYGGGFNGMARAGKQLTRALVDFTKGKGFAERSANLTDEERQAMAEGYERGIIERTQGHDLAGVGETGVEYSAARERAMKIVSWGFHHAERLNREVTFLAAYRMAREKGLSHEAAITKAGELTWKTHFDYSNTSRPRLMHSDTMKILLVFRNFQVNMLFRLFRDVHQAVTGETKEVRREAFTQLAGITGMMMLNAGITGTWLFGIAMVMAGLFMDDGEDPEEELKKAMVNVLGPRLAGVALHGVPGYVTGTSISGSVGMPDLWFRSPDSEKEGEEALQYWQSQLLGAVTGIGSQFARGISYIGKGETYRGIETMMPKMLKDPMKAYRFATDGAKNMRGDTVTDVTFSDVVKQAIGFTPARIAEQYKINNASYNKQQAILKERKQLMDTFYKADKKGDDEEIDKLMEKIGKYNEKYPDQAITGRSLIQSRKTRDRGADKAVGGMRYNSKLRDRLLEDQSPSIYGE